MSSKTQDCSVCCESGVKKLFHCPHCNFDACKNCWETFLTTTKDPMCLSCSHILTYSDLYSIFSRQFVDKVVIPYRRDVLFQKQRASITDTNFILFKERQIEKIKKEIANVSTEMSSLTKAIKRSTNEMDRESLQNQKRLKEDSYVILHQLEMQMNYLPRKNVRSCANPSCSHSGFICSETGDKCGECGKRTCPSCEVLLDEESSSPHQCSSEDRETLGVLSTQTKKCPGCDARIEKIDGCSQIWCSQCHTTFDWDTLEMERSVLHNPHFYEYQRKFYGGDLPSLPGSKTFIPYAHEVIYRWSQQCRDDNFLFQALTTERDFLESIELFELPVMSHEFDVVDFPIVRKRFVQGKMKETTFKKFLSRKEKEQQKSVAERRIIEKLLETCGKHIANSAHGILDLHEAIASLFEEYDKADEELARIAQVLKCGPVFRWR